MTLDRIRELLAAIAADDDGTRNASLLDAALPLLRRWTDATPITPEALGESGEWESRNGDWKLKAVTIDSWLTVQLTGGRFAVYHWDDRNCVSFLGSPRMMGHLNMIVDAIQGVK